MRVPKDLQRIVGRTEFKKSLGTDNKKSAYRLCRQYTNAAENHFAELRLKLFRATLNGQIEQGNVDHHRDASTVIDIINSSPPPVKPHEIKMSELIKLYVNEEMSKRGKHITSGLENNLMRFLEIVEDKPFSHYTVEDRQKYRDVLLKIPKRINGPKYKNRSIKNILKREYSREERLSITSVNKRLIDVATFLNWSVNNGLIESHPFKNAVLKTQKTDDSERPSLTDHEIKKLLENLPEDHRSLSWCILTTCFSGLRQSEVAALDSADITSRDGIWCLDINDRGDKRLKNKNARRIIPLHPTLLSAGLVELAQSRTGQKLFPDIKPYRGKYGHQISKDFAKFRKSIGINGAGQTFHGIRHSVISKLWSAGIPEAHTAAVAGHQRGERESNIRYAKKNDLRPIVTAINAIDYGDIRLPSWIFQK